MPPSSSSARASIHLSRLAKVRAMCNAHQSIDDTPSVRNTLGSGMLRHVRGCCFCFDVFPVRSDARIYFIIFCHQKFRRQTRTNCVRCTEKYASVISQSVLALHWHGNVAPRLSQIEDGPRRIAFFFIPTDHNQINDHVSRTRVCGGQSARLTAKMGQRDKYLGISWYRP